MSKAITISTLSELKDALDEAMFSIWCAIESLNEYDTDDDFRIWADMLNDMHGDMQKRFDQLERDEYAEHQEEVYELTREYYRGLL